MVLTRLTDDTGIFIRRLFKSQSLLLMDRMKLSQGNSILTIDPVRREDAGDFSVRSSTLSVPAKVTLSGWTYNMIQHDKVLASQIRLLPAS
ncbi:Carcinoembryonic antigen-related cell adhesion molecule 1 [Myotis davidii]|uniref:Carcinoembryonic antigen-related cell adhesion molecule 1 n=1 Tax=Myotis davidii TaxID=225400 RepID=L5M7Y1_MYODS|nr:Carcinoembryonic antigen-related cell adhesion molecule 1 [Myotis davidii]